MNAIYFLLLGEIFLLFLAYLVTDKDILSPSVLMCIMFVVSTIFAVLNVGNWDYGATGYSVDAVVLLLTGILCYIIVETVGRKVLFQKQIVRNTKDNKKRETIQEYARLNIFNVPMSKVIGVLLLDIIICILYFNAIRQISGGGGSIFEMFAAYRRNGIALLAGTEAETVGGVVAQLTNVVVISGYIAGYIFINNWIAKDKNTKRQICLGIIVILAVLPSMMSAGRTQILKFFIAFIIYYYILWNQKFKWSRNVSEKFIKLGIISLMAGIPLFYYCLKLLGRQVERGILDYTSSYLGSSIYLFGEYVENPVKRVLWGEESLVGVRKIFSFLGIGEASTAYNLEFRPVGSTISNIYTFFRAPLHDFGVLGMYMFTALVALFFAWMYWGKIKWKKRTNKVNYWVLIYGFFIYWIFVASMLQYSLNYISVGTIVKLILLWIGYRIAIGGKYKFIIRNRII